MYIALMGTAQQGSGPAGLSVSITVANSEFPPFEGVVGEDFPQDTNPGDIDLIGVGSGGDGSYSYAWSIAESGDDNNINSGNIAILSAGTQNVAQYDEAPIRGTDTGLTSGDVVEVVYVFTCTVTDGTGATAQASENVRVSIVAL